jgi:hypothetical protein
MSGFLTHRYGNRAGTELSTAGPGKEIDIPGEGPIVGGPVVGVALHKPLDDTQIDELDDWLRSVGTVSNAARYPSGEWLGQIDRNLGSEQYEWGRDRNGLD